MLIRSWQRAMAAIAGVICLACSSSALAQTDLSVVDAQRLAYGLIERGQYNAALELLDTLQQEGRNQTAVVYVARSRAQRGLGLTRDAVQNGRRAFRLADTKAERFLAARSVAQAHSTSGNRTLAQVWLRLASQYAPNDTAYALNRRDFAYVRSRNPISLNFDLNVSPTDNINNAPTDNTIVLGGIPFTNTTLLPISGTSIETDVELSYRLPATQTRFSELHLSYYSRRVILSGDADEIDPDLEASDLARSRLGLAWGNNFRRVDRPWVVDTTIEAFADWSAGDHIQNGLSLDVGYRFPVAPNQSIRLAGGVEVGDRRDDNDRSFERYSAQATWFGAFEKIGQFQVTAYTQEFNSVSSSVARDVWGLSSNYRLPIPVLTADLSASFLYAETRFDDALLAFGSDPRFDQTFRGTLSAALPAAEVFGFLPVIEVTRERVKSNVFRFDTNETNVGLSIRSSF